MPQRSQPTNAPEPVAQQPTIDSTQSPSAEAVDAQIAPSTSLLRTASQTSPRQRRQMTAAISRVQGNQHLQRMIAALQRHTSEGIEEPENAIQRSVIQRHTSEGIEEPENAIQRLFIQRNLADDLTRAMDGIGTDEDAIWNAIDANPGERQGIMDDARIMARLRDELDREDMAKTLQKLGAPLADQINNAISGAGTDDTALWAAIGGAAADQKQMVLRNAALMRSLRDDLSQEDAGRAMRELGASLTEQIYAAIEGAGTEEQEIYDAISVAPADQKQAALRNRALMEALSDDMNQAEMLRALELLGASLADRLNMAMDGIGTDEDSIFAITAAATEAQRLEVRSNTTLMVRLRDELDQADMLRVMRSLASSVADRIDVALDGWGADDPAILALLTDATDAEQLQIKENTALVARMQNEMGEPTYAQVCSLIGLPVPGATPDAGATPAAGAPPDAGVAPDGGAAPAATPAEPQTLIGKVTAALDASPPNPAAAIAAITTATPADRATVREASALRDRLYAALSQAEVLNVMTLLEVPIGTRLGTLLDRSATSADIRAHITAATPVEKQAVLGDSVLLNRLIEAAGAADRDALMIALGDTLNNRIDQALLDTPTTAAVWALIRAADAAAR
ncbi:MAG: hypothetical protein SH847_04425, partial [Roseiflexaceae bacterium]|nr:hypothetical protein [Roseiflexaceae bacterium]